MTAPGGPGERKARWYLHCLQMELRRARDDIDSMRKLGGDNFHDVPLIDQEMELMMETTAVIRYFGERFLPKVEADESEGILQYWSKVLQRETETVVSAKEELKSERLKIEDERNELKADRLRVGNERKLLAEEAARTTELIHDARADFNLHKIEREVLKRELRLLHDETSKLRTLKADLDDMEAMQQSLWTGLHPQDRQGDKQENMFVQQNRPFSKIEESESKQDTPKHALGKSSSSPSKKRAISPVPSPDQQSTLQIALSAPLENRPDDSAPPSSSASAASASVPLAKMALRILGQLVLPKVKGTVQPEEQDQSPVSAKRPKTEEEVV